MVKPNDANHLSNHSSLIVEKLSGINLILNSIEGSIPEFKLNRDDPANFIVNEIQNNGLLISKDTDLTQFKAKRGLFSYHVLCKRGIDTPYAINLISKALKISSKWIRYAGLKDAKAETCQLISIWSPNGITYPNIKLQDISLSKGVIGKYSLNLGDLNGNRFLIRLTSENDNFNQNENLKNLLETIKHKGFPNFFGVQRFGSLRPISHLIGKALIQKDWRKAALGYLGITSHLEQPFIRDLRLEVNETEDYKSFLKKIPKKFQYEAKIAKELSRSQNYQKAIFALPETILTLFVGAYQSFIFNWTLSKLIYNQSQKIKEFPNLPLIGYKTSLNEYPTVIREEIEQFLFSDNISLSAFNQYDTWIKVSGSRRKTIQIPKDFDFKFDNQSIKLAFSLSKSAYATSLIREIIRNHFVHNEKTSLFENNNAYKTFLRANLLIPPTIKDII